MSLLFCLNWQPFYVLCHIVSTFDKTLTTSNTELTGLFKGEAIRVQLTVRLLSSKNCSQHSQPGVCISNLYNLVPTMGRWYHSTYIRQRRGKRMTHWRHGSTILAYHTNLTALKIIIWPSHGNPCIATSTSQRYEILQKSFVTKCLDAVYCHIIFVIFHKTLSPTKVNLTKISVKIVVYICEPMYPTSWMYHFAHKIVPCKLHFVLCFSTQFM